MRSGAGAPVNGDQAFGLKISDSRRDDVSIKPGVFDQSIQARMALIGLRVVPVGQGQEHEPPG